MQKDLGPQYSMGSQCDRGWPVSWKGQLMLARDMDGLRQGCINSNDHGRARRI